MQAFFIQGIQRKLFSVYYPAKQGESSKFILHIPAFAEEMNCARHVISQQSRAFADQGYSVLQIDLFGTGESTGEFSDATWDIWKLDIDSACQWLALQGANTVTFWGLRLGSLLAMDCMSSVNLKVEKLILWHPVLFGEPFVTQFLRLKTVAGIMNGSLSQVKITDLKQQIMSGQFIEVAGYLINPEMMTILMQLDVLKIDISEDVEIFLIYISNDNAPLQSKTVEATEFLKKKQCLKSIRHVKGNSFWAVHGGALQPDLLLRTLESCS